VSLRCCFAAAAFVRAMLLLFLTVCRAAGRHRPIRSTIRSSVERFGAPLDPMPAGDPSRRPSLTTHPHHVQARWLSGRVVSLGRETEGGGGPSGARSEGGGRVEGRAGAGRRRDRSPDVCRGVEWCAPYSVCKRHERLLTAAEVGVPDCPADCAARPRNDARAWPGLRARDFRALAARRRMDWPA
jgi:hypothetical protein